MLLIVLFGLAAVASAADVDLRCTSDVCADWLTKNQCPQLKPDCVANGRIFSDPGASCGCCDYCIEYLAEGEFCAQGLPGQPTAAQICGAGLSCQRADDEEHATCKRMRTACHAAQDAFDASKESGTLGHLQLRPVCDDRGDFAPARCIPGSICHCVSPTGQRIFGEQPFSSPEVATTMKCTCARDAWRAEKIGLGRGAFFAHCLPDGSYDPLQCVDGQCACVDDDGGPVGSRRVHLAMLDKDSLGCFNATLGHVRSHWARPCERRRYDTLHKFVADNSTLLWPELWPVCGHDGRYERVQARQESLFCADEHGEQIERFEVLRSAPEAKVTNCNCARTRLLLQRAEEAGLAPELPECCPNGNFKAWQCARGLCYCVDAHGAQLHQEVPEENLEELPCFSDNPCSVHQGHQLMM